MVTHEAKKKLPPSSPSDEFPTPQNIIPPYPSTPKTPISKLRFRYHHLPILISSLNPLFRRAEKDPAIMLGLRCSAR